MEHASVVLFSKAIRVEIQFEAGSIPGIDTADSWVPHVVSNNVQNYSTNRVPLFKSFLLVHREAHSAA